MKRCSAVGAVLLASLLGQASAPARADAGAPAMTWKKPAKPAVSWRGIPQLDGGADAVGGVLYPAPTLIGFLASIMVHAVASSAAQSAEQERLQKEADAVLEPYAQPLQALSSDVLWRTALALPTAPTGARLADELPASGWRAEATPRYALAPGAGTLVLDLGARLQGPAGDPLELVVRVVSTPPAASDIKTYWSAEEGRALRETAAQLLAHALALATREAQARQRAAPAAEDTPFRTHRYRLGQLVRAERSQLLEQACGRMVLRTLRGGLLSVPTLAERPAQVAAPAAVAASPAAPSAPSAAASAAPGSVAAALQEPVAAVAAVDGAPGCPALTGL